MSAGFIGLFTLSACQTTGGFGRSVEARNSLAQTIAYQGGLDRADVNAPPFVLARWQRISDPARPIHVYIEGDGLAWLSKSRPSGNPTPTDPVALRLAAADNTPNVIYLARPCQYTNLRSAQNKCAREYWMGKRYASEVIKSYDQALDQIKTQYGGANFHLIGFSGGANIAGLLAAQRDDVKSLRTVSGNVDNDFFTSFHKVSAMPLSLNMADEAHRLANMPQRHFVGGDDKFVPRAVFESYAQKLQRFQSAPCNILTYRPQADHTEGWVSQWQTLLSLPLDCG